MNKEKRIRILTAFLLPSLRTILFIVSGVIVLYLPPFRGKSLAEVSRWWCMICIAVNLITIVILRYLLKSDGKTFGGLINHNKQVKTSIKIFLIVVIVMFILAMGGLWGFSSLVYGYMPVTNTQPLPVWAAIIVLVLRSGLKTKSCNPV